MAGSFYRGSIAELRGVFVIGSFDPGPVVLYILMVSSFDAHPGILCTFVVSSLNTSEHSVGHKFYIAYRIS